MRRAVLALALAGLLLPGCAGHPRPDFAPEVVDASSAVIYIYRPPSRWGGQPVRVYIDQQFQGALGEGQYLARAVEPGRRLVRAQVGSDAVVEVGLSAGASAFLEVRSSYWDQRPSITLPDEPTARARIAQTARVAAGR